MLEHAARPAGHPDPAAPLAGRGHDRPGRDRHPGRHASVRTAPRRRRRPGRSRRARRDRPRPRRVRRVPGVPRGGRRAHRPGEVAVRRAGDARDRAAPRRRSRRARLRGRRAGGPRATCRRCTVHIAERAARRPADRGARRAVVPRGDGSRLPDRRSTPPSMPCPARSRSSSRRGHRACTAAATPTGRASSPPDPGCCRCRCALDDRRRRGLPRSLPRGRRLDRVGRGAHRRPDPALGRATRGGSCRTLWCELVQGGCDPVLLRTQSLITPACGLGLHSEHGGPPGVPHRRPSSPHRVHSQAVATRLQHRVPE